MNQLARHAVGASALGAVLVAALAIPGAQALDRPGVVTVTAVGSRHTHVDLGPKGKSVGDQDQYSSLVYNKRVTPTAIGRGSMLCTTVSSSNQSCSATYFLPKGEIVVQGVIGSRLIYALPVVGGTGLYDNVRGTLTVTSLRRAPSVRELLVFRLVV
jgi:hypothetical protein